MKENLPKIEIMITMSALLALALLWLALNVPMENEDIPEPTPYFVTQEAE